MLLNVLLRFLNLWEEKSSAFTDTMAKNNELLKFFPLFLQTEKIINRLEVLIFNRNHHLILYQLTWGKGIGHKGGKCASGSFSRHTSWRTDHIPASSIRFWGSTCIFAGHNNAP